MRKPIILVNLLLLLLAVWLAAGARSTWRGNHARYARFSASSPAAAPVDKGAGAGPPAADAGRFFTELVSRNLFSADRNNEQPVVKVEKKAPPPLPYVIGTLDLGSGMVALMAEQKQATQGAFRRLKAGEEIGGYRVAEIAEHKVVVEFEGEKTAIDVYESAASLAGPATTSYTPPSTPGRTEPQVVNAVTAASAPVSAGPQASSEPTREADTDYSALFPAFKGDPNFKCVPEGGRLKCTYRMAFGTQTWYKDLPPAPKPK